MPHLLCRKFELEIPNCILFGLVLREPKFAWLKTAYIEFARLESSANAMHAAIVSPAVAMAADVHCQRPPQEPSVISCCIIMDYNLGTLTLV